MSLNIDIVNPYFYNYYYTPVSMPDYTEEEAIEYYKEWFDTGSLLNTDIGQRLNIVA